MAEMQALVWVVLVAGGLMLLGMMAVWVWAVGEPFTFPKAAWEHAGYSRAVTVTMCALVPFGPYAYALFVRPHVVRALRDLGATQARDGRLVAA